MLFNDLITTQTDSSAGFAEHLRYFVTVERVVVVYEL